ncbi:MAG: GNAT family N-acetyltransferase [Clostridia bacterium]|nr:GNAT family N-acetyltransferase [Clostridia bacterium]
MGIAIETDVLLIRETVFDDYRYYVEWENDPEMTRYFALDKGRTYEDVVTEGFAYKNNESVIDLTITEKDTGEPLGRIIISRIEPHYKSADITKIYVGGNNRGQGIGTEALQGILHYFFCEMGYERVTLDYFTGNTRAAALYRSLGFVDEGVARNACSKDGVYYDLNLMSMLRSEYFA